MNLLGQIKKQNSNHWAKIWKLKNQRQKQKHFALFSGFISSIQISFLFTQTNIFEARILIPEYSISMIVWNKFFDFSKLLTI